MGLLDFLKKDVTEKTKVPALDASVTIDGRTYPLGSLAATSFTAVGGAKLGQGSKVKMTVTLKDAKEQLVFASHGLVSGIQGKDAKISFVDLPDARRLQVAGFLTRYVRR